MIKINLLPFRAARKKENIKRQITIYIGIIMVVILLVVWQFITLSGKLGKAKDTKKGLQAELKTYESTIKKINRLNKKIKRIKAKLNVIDDLEKGKMGPVRLLDELADAVPKDKLWLRSYNEKAGRLTLAGTAMDNETVALFMVRLEQTKSITAVDLRSAKLRRVKRYGVDVADFVLDCKTYAFKKKAPPKKKKKKRKKRRK